MEKNKVTEWISKIVAPASITVGTAVATTGIVKVIAKVAEKDKGTQKSFGKLTLFVGGVLVAIGGAYKGIKTWCDNHSMKETSFSDADNYTAKCMADAMMYRANAETDAKYGRNRQPENKDNDSNPDESKNKTPWDECFTKEMPELPPFLEKIMRIVPAGYETAMLLHLLSMLGALCFSKVRAKYLDNDVHAPNIQVFVEARWGAGKAKLDQLYKWLFKRIITSDLNKINSLDDGAIEEGTIIQTTGIGTSMSRYTDILAANQGVHSYMFNSEARALFYDMKKGNGLNFDFIRKAFENGMICRNNRSRDSKNGIFPIFLNYTITGTPKDIATTFKKELEGGTLSRICWTTIPEQGREGAKLGEFKAAELSSIQDQIAEWQTKFCYRNEDDRDVAVPEFNLNLNYVCEALDEWNKEQYDQGEDEGNQARKDVRMRMAAIAFHCSMVIHMLYGNKNDAATRQKVVNLALYIANYCTERFLWKYGDEQNKLYEDYEKGEDSKQEVKTESDQCQSTIKTQPITDPAELYRLHEILDDNGQRMYGWDTLTKMSGMSRSTLIRTVTEYGRSLRQ